ncbi:unnamed protein product [Tetraodon nigroviridis]|uniref:(spotted green pufferfish) hypothetical protein n=1 Tax=Tetraodon nigroviridis TaxID=99883 RepID=Q4RQT5_TETNG|nr:unnamed protein product [Tetraodon nigroviridis]
MASSSGPLQPLPSSLERRDRVNRCQLPRAEPARADGISAGGILGWCRPDCGSQEMKRLRRVRLSSFPHPTFLVVIHS